MDPEFNIQGKDPKVDPIVEGEFLLEKFPGKGGWTYAPLPVKMVKSGQPFGWLRVSGSINSFELKRVKLMPMGDGRLFLPVKKAIRKTLGKEAGDSVFVRLFREESSTHISEEIIACFEQEAGEVLIFFKSLPESNQKAYLDWIYDSKTDATRVSRIAEMMNMLSQKEKF